MEQGVRDPERDPGVGYRPFCTCNVLCGVWAPAREQSSISVVSLLKRCFWKKKKSNGQVDGAFLEGREVGNKWDVDFKTRRHAGPTK